MIKDLYKKNKIIIIPYLLFVIVGLTVYFYLGKDATHIFLNKYHSKFFDVFSKWATYLVSGASGFIASAIVLFFSIKLSIVILTSFISSGVFVQILKLIFFPDLNRPAFYFKGIYNIHLIDGIKQLYHYSFPSGHAATAMSIFFSIALFVENKFLKSLFFIIAIIICYSRVYLSQHFLEDIIVGSLIGIIFSFYFKFYFSDKKFDRYSVSVLKFKK